MTYVDAGYAVALVVTSGFGLLLWGRRRRLERLVASVSAAAMPDRGGVPVPDRGGAPVPEELRS